MEKSPALHPSGTTVSAYGVVAHLTFKFASTVPTFDERRTLIGDKFMEMAGADKRNLPALGILREVATQNQIADIVAPLSTITDTKSSRLSGLRVYILLMPAMDLGSNWAVVVLTVLLEVQKLIAMKERINMRRLSMQAAHACGKVTDEACAEAVECLPLRVPPGHEDMARWDDGWMSCRLWFDIFGLPRMILD